MLFGKKKISKKHVSRNKSKECLCQIKSRCILFWLQNIFCWCWLKKKEKRKSLVTDRKRSLLTFNYRHLMKNIKTVSHTEFKTQRYQPVTLLTPRGSVYLCFVHWSLRVSVLCFIQRLPSSLFSVLLAAQVALLENHVKTIMSERDGHKS